MVTVPDFSVPHTPFWCLWKEDPLGSTRVDNAQKLLKKLFHIKIHEISPGEIQKSNVLKDTCLMSSYFKSEEYTMKNEIPAAIFLAPPPPLFEEKYLPNVLKGSTTNYLVIIHTTAVFQL